MSLLLVGAPSLVGSFALLAPMRGAALPARAALAPKMLALPSFGSKTPEPTGPSEEVQGLYRMLGVTEDADYDEINRAYEDLCDKYKGETKRLIKLQVAKDKILDDRLRLRMAGALKSTVSKDDWRIADNRKAAKEPMIKIPPFLEDVMELPAKQLLLKNAAVFFGISLLPIISKQWASTSITLGFGIGMFLLYNRGMPSTGGSVEAEMRPPKVKPLLLTAGIVTLAGTIGSALSLILPLRFLMQELAITLCSSLGFFSACTFFKVQDEY